MKGALNNTSLRADVIGDAVIRKTTIRDRLKSWRAQCIHTLSCPQSKPAVIGMAIRERVAQILRVLRVFPRERVTRLTAFLLSGIYSDTHAHLKKYLSR